MLSNLEFSVILIISTLTFTYINEKFNVRILWILFICWVVPIVISQDSTLLFNQKWKLITYQSSISVIIGFYFGYVLAKLVPLKILSRAKPTFNIKYLSKINYSFQLISVISFLYIYFSVGNFPLISDDILANRIFVQNYNPVLWTLTQLSFASASISIALIQEKKLSKISKFFIVLIFVLIFLSGWRNYLLMYILYLLIPFLFLKKINVLKIGLFVISFISIFILIGWFRGDFGDSIKFDGIITMVGLYVYPNFLNFEYLTNYTVSGSHLYTIQFLFKPIFEFLNFNVVPSQTSISAFNVSTGMNALYQDGGIFNILITFSFLGFFLKRLEKAQLTDVFANFWRSTLVISIVLFHNGWTLLNFMPTFVSIVIFLFILLNKLFKNQHLKYQKK